MVARPGLYQASNNAGELKPEVHGRTDIKQFYAGLAYARNVEPVPQGGSRLSPRSRHLSIVRRTMTTVSPSVASIPSGPFTGAAVIATFTLPTPIFVTVVSFATLSSSIALGAILQVEYQSPIGVGWQAFGPPFKTDTRAVQRTIALAPDVYREASAFRLRMVSAPPAAVTFTITGATVDFETATRSAEVRLRPFTFSLTQTYVAVFTHRHVDFFRDGVFVGGAKTAFAASHLPVFCAQQRFDTMLLYHEDVPSQRIVRNAADNEWIVDAIPSTNIPRVDLGGVYTNHVDDYWLIYLKFPTASTSTHAGGKNIILSVTVSGEETAGVSTAGGSTAGGGGGGNSLGGDSNGTGGAVDWALFRDNVKAALIALPSVYPGITVDIDVSVAGLAVLHIVFLGAGNSGVRNTMSAQVVNTSEAAATCTHYRFGVAGGENLFDTSAGYPACANFYQQRLVTGGFRSERGAILASVTGEYFDTNVESVSPSGAILARLDTDGAERLHHIARARHLVLFTTDAEYFISDRALNRTAVPTIVNCSREGSSPLLPIVENENSLIYVNYHRTILNAATYDDVSSAYVSLPLSLLASHIACDQVDMALQKSGAATDAARLWQVKSDGTMCVGVMLRNQDVIAFVRWETAGKVLAVCVDGVNVPHIVVERTTVSGPHHYLERLELGLIFDATVTQTFGTPATTVPNLAMHEGAQVWAIADGFVSGPHVVAGGAITLSDPSSVVSVGRWTAPLARALPMPSEVTEGVVLKRPKRVHTVRVDVIDTTSIAIGANDRPAKDVALFRAGALVDAALAPVSREIVVTGLVGFSNAGHIEITQTQPGKLAWSGFVREARK